VKRSTSHPEDQQDKSLIRLLMESRDVEALLLVALPSISDDLIEIGYFDGKGPQ
jgi:hypothetical protein